VNIALVHERKLIDSSDFNALEKDYWDMVELGKSPITRVEYAADIDTMKYGSGFGRAGQKLVDPRQLDYIDHPWNLNNLPNQFNSLMQFPREHDISGINIPWLYVGMKYSTFCWHYEDLMLHSINYSHWGQPKMWYCVPDYDREKFEKAVR
jgi:histone demethylase JARID1